MFKLYEVAEVLDFIENELTEENEFIKEQQDERIGYLPPELFGDMETLLGDEMRLKFEKRFDCFAGYKSDCIQSANVDKYKLIFFVSRSIFHKNNYALFHLAVYLTRNNILDFITSDEDAELYNYFKMFIQEKPKFLEYGE